MSKKKKKGTGDNPVSVYTGAKVIKKQIAARKKAMDALFGPDQPPGKRD